MFDAIYSTAAMVLLLSSVVIFKRLRHRSTKRYPRSKMITILLATTLALIGAGLIVCLIDALP